MIRPLSLNEKLYSVAQEIFPPFTIQLVVKGDGIIPNDLIKESVAKLIDHIPALQYKLKGNYWLDGGAGPNLIFHDIDFDDDLNSPIINSPLDDRKGITCEIHLFHGESTAILFRVLHSLMDGVGLLTMIDAFFDIINKKEISKKNDFISDEDLKSSLKTSNNGKHDDFNFRWKALESFDENNFNFSNDCISIQNRIDGLIGKIAKWHTSESGATSKFLIPVNIRRHSSGIHSASNLSLPIYLEAKEDETESEIQAKLLTKLNNNEELSKGSLERFGKTIPSSWLKRLLKRKALKSQVDDAFPMSGFLSDMGNVDLDRLCTSSFHCTDLIPISVYVPLAPFSIFACHHRGGTRIGISLPEQFDKTRLLNSLTNYLGKTTKNKDEKLHQHFSPLAIQIRAVWAKTLKLDAELIEPQDTYASLGGGSLNLLLLIHSLELKFLDGNKKILMKQIIPIGGKLTIHKTEELILNLK